MRVRRALLVSVMVLLLIVGGLAVGSNMGFKYAPTIPDAEKNVDHWVSLPYKSSYSTAKDVCDVVPFASLVSRFDPVTSGRVDWTCPFGTNFTLQAGEGVFLRVTAASSPVFVGSHDPDLTVPVGGFTELGKDYIISIPYHTTATVANDLCGEVPSATLISRFEPSTASRIDWTCPFGTNFSIELGEAVAVRVSSASSGFVPDHY